jgi:hypothetical protein
LKAFLRFIFPVPVTLNLFLALECDLLLGMVSNLILLYKVLCIMYYEFILQSLYFVHHTSY